ncbi:unnamed protein product [Hermetia illucens]|uniref:Uncharacterized protein n=1 Tax=Hermetia illucens TaxID=343691 RepID=A0A7R8YTS4_HERIL|nr:unnamed protein product [Hermetia illucens]
MVRTIRVLYNGAKEEKNASKKSSVTQATQVTPPQNPKGGKLEKRSRECANDSFGSSQDAKRQKGLSPAKGKGNKVTNIMETAAQAPIDPREAKHQKGTKEAWTKVGGRKNTT